MLTAWRMVLMSSSPVREYAVKFGRHPDMGLESEKAFPYIYTFRNRNDDQWSAQASLADQADAVSNIVNGIGPLVPKNSRISYNVMLDQDYIFKLLNIKYTCYYPYEVPANGAPGHFSNYEWHEDLPGYQPSGSANAAITTTNTSLTDTRLSLVVNAYVGSEITCNGKTLTITSNTATTFNGTAWSGGGNPGNGNSWSMSLMIGNYYWNTDGLDPDMNKIGTPLSRYINITLSFSGAQAQILYGGDDCNAVPRMRYGSRREPIVVDSIQGYDYGFLALRTPKLLTQQACLIFEITNTHPTKDLVVGAAIYGMKIRM